MKFSTSRMERLILAATGACAIGLLCFGNVFAQTAGTPPSGDENKAPEDKTVTVNGVQEKVFSRGNGITPPKVIESHSPTFQTGQGQIDGTVVPTLVVSSTGRPTNLRVNAKSLRSDMDNLAIDALRGWRFRPATKDGKPVSAMIAVNVDFHLR
jgi:TonB family protein